MSRSDFVGDAKLIPRLKEYLRSSNLLTAKAVNILSVADDLQVRYRDYARKKKDAFRIMVQKAYTLVQKDLKTDAIQSDDSEASFSSDTEKYVSYESPNTMNRGLQNMYKKVSTPTDGSRSPVTKDVSSIRAPVTKNAARCEDANSSGVFVIDRVGDRTNAGSSGNQSLKRKDIDIMEEVPRKVSPMATRALLEPIDYVANSPRENNMDVGTPQSGGIDKQKTIEIIQETNSSSEVKVRALKSVKLNRSQAPKSSTQSGRPAKKTVSHVQQPTVTFADIGGNKNVLKKLYKLMVHFRHHLVHDQLGVRLPRGLLLHGPPGCGKTMLANAIAGELKLPFLQLAATEIVSGVSGESEEKVRDMFDEAMANSPCVLFIDEIDSITPKREVASKDMERRIVTQLLTCMDGLQNKPEAQVLVIGATNRPDSLDSSLRRAGRFDREIAIGIPDEESRMRIIEVLTRKLRLEANFDVLTLARNTPGYVGADLVDLVGEATMMAVDRVFKRLSETRIPVSAVVDGNCVAADSATAVAATDAGGFLVTQSSAETQIQIVQTLDASRDADMEALLWLLQQPPMTAEQVGEVCVTMADFDLARQEVQPSSKREGFATIPGVTWDDVGSLKDVREELQMAILAPVRYPEQFRAFGVRKPSGILLIGPPGCGKTLLAKAIANESGINFISVKGPELFNMYVGESERAVRQVFQRARNSAPCLIFFDELDALCPDRNSGSEGGAKVQVVNTLLTEMDGAEDRQQVFVMGATNKPDNIDDAMLRPGRLGKVFYVGLPTEEHRLDILQTITRNKPKLAVDVSLEELASRCINYSGADLMALVEEASLTAIREAMKSGTSDSCVHKRHFDVALTKVRPSVTDANRVAYEKLRMKYCKPTGLS